MRARFTPEKGWRIVTVRRAEFHTRRNPVPVTIACVERIPTLR